MYGLAQKHTRSSHNRVCKNNVVRLMNSLNFLHNFKISLFFSLLEKCYEHVEHPYLSQIFIINLCMPILLKL